MQGFFRAILRQVVLINLLFVLCMIVGGYAMLDLPVERYPNVKMGKVQIDTFFPGASPSDVETLVTREVEEALDDLESVEFIQSTSYRQRSNVTVKFIDDTDYDTLYDELRIKILGILNELPDGIDPPTFTVIDVSEWLPAISVNLVGDRSNRALSLMAKEMKLFLRRIPGVAEVALDGDYTREFHVTLNPRLMDKYGVTFEEISTALENNNITIPAGDFSNDSGEFSIIVDRRFRDREQVLGTIIRLDGDGSYVTVADVTESASLDYRDPQVISSVNGKASVTLRVRKSPEGNALDIVPAVERVVEEFKPKLDEEGVSVVLTQDQSVQVYDAIRTLGNNLMVGIGLVFVIVFIFMGLRNAILTVVGIPFAFLVTMIFMWVTGNSLNEITLFAFVLVSGIIVDDAIVVIENIYRHLQEGKEIHDAVVVGASEVALPVVAATTTTVAAFLPMLMMTGSTGEFFAQIPIAITAAIAASLFECLIILPPHFMDWPGWRKAQHDARHKHTSGNERWIMRVIRRGTNAIVGFTLRHRFISLFLVVVLFAGSLFVLGVSITGKMPLIRIKFFPEEYANYFVDVEGPITSSVEDTSDKLREISKYMAGRAPQELRSATAFAGFYVNQDYEPVFGAHLGHIIVEMPEDEHIDLPDNPEMDPVRHLQWVRNDLKKFEGEGWAVRVRAEPGGPPAGKSVNIRVVGPNPDSVQKLAEDVTQYMLGDEKIAPYLLDFGDDQGAPSRILRFRVNERRAAEYGLSPSQVAGLAGSILDGRFSGKYRSTDEDIDLRLKIDSRFMQNPANALAIPAIQTATGPIRLGDIASLESYTETEKLTRYQNNRAITLSSNLQPGAATSPAAVVNRIRNWYANASTAYPGAELNFAGEFESTQRSYTSLAAAFVVAILVIYLILATQFGSYVQPLIILSAVIFSLIGVIMGKLITQGLFTVNSFIATVGVTGVVVNDSLVLLDFINREYASGKSRREAIMEGIRVRLRPILLTTLTTSLGLLPMALGIPSYSLVWGAMASTFVTGLCTATFLTLFIVPIEWDLVMGAKERMARWQQRRLVRKGYVDTAEQAETMQSSAEDRDAQDSQA